MPQIPWLESSKHGTRNQVFSQKTRAFPTAKHCSCSTPWLTWFCKIFLTSPSPLWGKHTTCISPFLLFIHDSYFRPQICFSCNHSQFHNGNSIFLRAHAPNKNSDFSLIPVSNPSANPAESSFKINPGSDHFLAPQSIFS